MAKVREALADLPHCFNLTTPDTIHTFLIFFETAHCSIFLEISAGTSEHELLFLGVLFHFKGDFPADTQRMHLFEALFLLVRAALFGGVEVSLQVTFFFI